MRRLSGGGLALALAALGAATLRALVVPRRSGWPRATGDDPRPGRWQVVTVARPRAELLPGGRWPEPLRPLDGAVELYLRPAPGGRGTELAVRPLGGVRTLPGMAAHLVGDDPGRYLRDVLRRVRQLAETGELLLPDRAPGDRPAG
ncbi:hypothetical protein V6U81_07070 [Micromonospora sp. CPCC 205711]|uniref:hypothetical protein n=1 Tax=Micromonospora sp. CPCC 205547 TaxID=3122400 RepID=UPI002FF0CF17